MLWKQVSILFDAQSGKMFGYCFRSTSFFDECDRQNNRMSSVYKWKVFKQKHETGDVRIKALSSRKRVTTRSENRYLKFMYLRNRHTRSPVLNVESENVFGVNLSALSEQAWFMQYGLHAYCPLKIFLPKNKYKQNRLAWSTKHIS